MKKITFLFTIVGLLLISCKPITVFEPTIASDGIKEDIIIVEEFSPFVDSIGPPPGSITDMITYEKTLNQNNIHYKVKSSSSLFLSTTSSS